MASVMYNEAKRAIAAGEIDLNAHDIRVALLMTNTTADTENDAINTVANFTTLDEFDGSGYTSGGVALANEAVNKDDANDRAEFDADDATFTTIGAGTRAIQGALVYKFVTALSSSIPICFVDFPADVTADGSTLVVQWNAEGILQLA